MADNTITLSQYRSNYYRMKPYVGEYVWRTEYSRGEGLYSIGKVQVERIINWFDDYAFNAYAVIPLISDDTVLADNFINGITYTHQGFLRYSIPDYGYGYFVICTTDEYNDELNFANEYYQYWLDLYNNANWYYDYWSNEYRTTTTDKESVDRDNKWFLEYNSNRIYKGAIVIDDIHTLSSNVINGLSNNSNLTADLFELIDNFMVNSGNYWQNDKTGSANWQSMLNEINNNLDKYAQQTTETWLNLMGKTNP